MFSGVSGIIDKIKGSHRTGLREVPYDGYIAELHKGEILIFMECAHRYTITEDDTKVLEIKNGPFLGVDTDRSIF